MKVKDLPYKRYTIEEGRDTFQKFKTEASEAENADDMMKARETAVKFMNDYSTASALAYSRYTLNTADEFYKGEMDYYDENGPLFSALLTEYSSIILDSPFRKGLEEKLGKQVIRKLDYSRKSFDERITEEYQKENQLVTKYSQLMAAMEFEFDGRKMPLSVLRGYLQSEDRETRRKASYSIGKGLSSHADELDKIYDDMVKVRNKMALKMGCKNFTELGMYRMGRTDYSKEDLANFRKNTVKDIVPAVEKIKAGVKKDLGIDRIMFYDDQIYLNSSSPKPVGTTADIFKNAEKMYDDMDPEIGEFMREMLKNEAFDVEARKNKWGGGYTIGFPNYKQPFILANFNGTTDDIDVITHEFGHALEYHWAYDLNLPEIDEGGMETAECHSMSMEFLAEKYMNLFFGDEAPKYCKKHLLESFCFIPYGVIVDEFQTNVYDNPDMTPSERKEMYLNLEKKYRPYLSYEGIPYLEEGTRWQYQMHIFESPFYYIDYCLAQTVALDFAMLSKKDYKEALKRYKAFLKKAGTAAFPDLVKQAGFIPPFEDGALADIAGKVKY